MPLPTSQSGDGGYLALAMATAALAIAGFVGYKTVYATPSSNGTCIRTVDMSKLSKLMINSMLASTAETPSAAASGTYQAQFGALDKEIAQHAAGCLLLRREMVVMPNADDDITGAVAKALNLDVTAPTGKGAPSARQFVPAQSTGAVSNEPTAKLD